MYFLISFLLCLLFTLAIVQALQYFARGYRKLPPGPIPLPVIGNLFDLKDKPHKSLAKLAQTYGPLMSLQLGQIATVVISSSTLAKQVLQTHDLTFSNRIVIDAIQALDHHKNGLPWIPVGPPWRNLRKICNSYIFAAQKLDSNRHLRRKKIQHLLSDVEESCRNGVPVNIGQAAFTITLNALSNTIFSLDLTDSNSDSAIAQEFKKTVDCIMEEAGKPNLSDYFPMIRRLDLQGIRHRMSIHFKKLFDLFDQMIDERLQLRKTTGYLPANDILDTLLTISEDKSEEMDIYRIKYLFLDLFVAGTHTSSSTLEWAMAELLHKPKTLLKAKAELEQRIGRGKMVEESDIDQLPYLQAIIKETFRMHPAVPLLLPRKAGTDVEMNGFIVPKGAQVLINAWAIGRDPSLWEDPNLFLPERFLGSDIDVQGRNFELIPFGSGRRICPGLPLAMRMLHLMLGSLINCFDWKLEDGVTPQTMDMEDRFGIALNKAQPLKAVAVRL